MGDHVPLQFLLGARARHYLDHHRRFEPTSNALLFSYSENPRNRERDARAMLQKVFHHTEASGKSRSEESLSQQRDFVRSVIDEAESASMSDTPPPLKRTPNDAKTHPYTPSDSLRSFHGYQVENPPFLGVDGVLKVPSVVSSEQNTELKVAKAKLSKHEMKRRKDMHLLLHQQQLDRREAECRLKDQRQETRKSVLKKHNLENDCDLPVLTTESFDRLASLSSDHFSASQRCGTSVETMHTQSAPQLVSQSDNNQHNEQQYDPISKKAIAALSREQKRALARVAAPRPTFLSTLKLDERSEYTENEFCGSGSTLNRQFSDLQPLEEQGKEPISRRRQKERDIKSNNEDAMLAKEQEVIQRELFARSEFGSKYLGGGFSVKKKGLESDVEHRLTNECKGIESSNVESLLEIQRIQAKVSGRQ